jgi:hypothetical protein
LYIRVGKYNRIGGRMMKLDEAIKHCEEVVESKRKQVENGNWEKGSLTERDCLECADEHRQLAEWLKELKQLRQQEPILDKIRAEIEQLPTKTRTNWDGCCPDIDYPEIEYVDVTKNKLLSIIDKYKTESEK